MLRKSEGKIKSMRPEKWLKLLILLLCGVLSVTAILTVWLDPFFHYHKPVKGFYYELLNERAQNDGIVKQFDYDALITGTSMTQNFKASEMSELFHCNAVKVSFSGATYKEIATLLDAALSSKGLRYVVAGVVDVSATFIQDKDFVHEEFAYPYLYNSNPFDDVKYLFNRDVLVQYTLPMIIRRIQGHPAGITSFDAYSNWDDQVTVLGLKAMGDMTEYKNDIEQSAFTLEDEEMTRNNVLQNIVRIAEENPDTTFYLFVPPISVVAWGMIYNEKNALRYIEAEGLALSMLAPLENVRLYSFSLDRGIVCNLDHYKDRTHYIGEINSRILAEMAADNPHYRITEDRVESYVTGMKELYLHYDYESLADRE